MAAIAAAIFCACSWGAADFIAGVQARRISVGAVMLGSAGTGVVLAGSAVLISGHAAPPASDIVYAVAAGLLALIALYAFFHALAIGTMSIVAPVSASGVAIPVVFGVARGDEVSIVVAAGFAATIVGVMLAGREQDAAAEHEIDARRRRRAFALALVAAASFGTLWVLIERASRSDELWSILIQKSVGLSVILPLVLWLSRRPGWQPVDRQAAAATVVAGALDTAAVTAFAYASTHGPLSVTSVLGAMFPVVTVLLAHRVLGERISRSQRIGVVLALGGVAMLAAS